MLEASEVANVVLFMLTRPRGMTIRDVVMLPTNFDLGARRLGGLVNPLRLRRVMPARCRSRMKPKLLRLGDHAQHSQDHAAHRPAGVDGRLQHPEACSFLFEFVHEVENVPGVPA